MDDVLKAIHAEVIRAEGLRDPINSAHEGYAVISEELDKFWEEVRKKDRSRLRMETELIQIAAMCVRTIEDLELWRDG